MELRDYQQDLVTTAAARLAESPVCVMPTGAGKTFTAAALLRQLRMRTLWVAHRRELILQARDTLRALDLKVGVIMPGHDPDPRAHVQVASIQTLARRGLPPVELVVLDEAHHACATSYRKLFDGCGVPVLGLTATPFRLDGRGLGEAGFGCIIQPRFPDGDPCTTAELCRRGLLVEPTVYAPFTPDLGKVRKRAGDYETEALSKVMSETKLVGDIVTHWQGKAEGRRTVCFAVDTAHSRNIVERFKAAGIQAEHLDGRTPREEREAVLGRLRSGATSVLSNVGIVNEGFDLPSLDVAIIARPTTSLCWHLQAVGRIMRACEGKAGALVLDHAGNHLRHGFVTKALAYTLNGDVAEATAPDGAPASTTMACPACALIVEAGTTECPACGYVWPVRTPGATEAEGELRLLTKGGKRPPAAELQRAWDDLVARQRLRGFKQGWCYYQFKRMYGFDPLVVQDRLVDPEGATMEDKRIVYEAYLAEADAKGYKRGWAAHRYHAAFGVWPRRMGARPAAAPAPPATHDHAAPPRTRRRAQGGREEGLARQLAVLVGANGLTSDEAMGAGMLHAALQAGSGLSESQWSAVALLCDAHPQP